MVSEGIVNAHLNVLVRSVSLGGYCSFGALLKV